MKNSVVKKVTSNLLQAGVGASSTVCGCGSVVVRVGGDGGGSDVFQMSAGQLRMRTRMEMMLTMLTLKRRPL